MNLNWIALLKVPVLSLVLLWTGPATGAQQLLANGGFELGLASWSTSGTGAGGCDTPWNAGSTGSAAGCVGYAPYNSFVNPFQGGLAAYNSFDGAGPKTYALRQNFLVPIGTGSGTLAWYDAVGFGSGYTFPQARVFSVRIYDGATLLQTVFSESFLMTGAGLFRDWQQFSVDISALVGANAGKTLTVEFANFVPQSFTGPGAFGLDEVRLDVAPVPLPATLPLLMAGLGALGLAASARRSHEQRR